MIQFKTIVLACFTTFLSSCVINHKRQEYSAIIDGTTIHGAIAESEYVAQIYGTNYSHGGGLSLDIRPLYSIHVRVISRNRFDSFSISHVTLNQGSRELEIVQSNKMLSTIATANEYRLFIAMLELKDSFDLTPIDSNEFLTIDVRGFITRDGLRLPFRAKSKFAFEKSRLLRFFTMDDALSI
jgi:hypothetical protein